MGFFRVTCSHCNASKKHQRLFRREYPSSAPVVVGGFLLALLFQSSRKPHFRCGACGREFQSHTIVSRCSLAMWIAVLLVAATLFLGLTVQAFLK